MKERTIDLRTIIVMVLVLFAIAVISTVSRVYNTVTATAPFSSTYTTPTTSTMQWSVDTCWGGGWMR